MITFVRKTNYIWWNLDAKVQVDPNIDQNQKMLKSRIFEMQNMQNSSKADAPDFERMPTVATLLPNSDKTSSLNWQSHEKNQSCSSIILFFKHELPCPTLEKNAMSYCVAFARYLHTIAVPYSRGGRSEAQHNWRQLIVFSVFGPGQDLAEGVCCWGCWAPQSSTQFVLHLGSADRTGSGDRVPPDRAVPAGPAGW